MKHDNAKGLFNYWEELRQGRAAPYRSELDPRAISSLLETTFILEHTPEATPRFRLAGTKLCDQFGMELRGMSALAFWTGESRTRMRDLLRRVVTEPCVGHVICTVETRSGYLYEAEFVYLPLRSDLGEMTRILGCAHYMGGVDARAASRAPVHHWIDRIEALPIDTFEAPGDAPRDDDETIDDPRVRTLRNDPMTRPLSIAQRKMFSAPRDRAAPLGAARPLLRAIEGGAAISTREESAEPRSRDHLRLIK
ncbi:MAG: PAS domain-containing protein [Neomegalonema sp.]|nr:PAS domain-containing protein [Neomegalonema sp.]